MDSIDIRIVAQLQRDSSLSQRALADLVGLSQNALWRRLRILERDGVITGYAARIDPVKVGVGLVVFVMLRTPHHSSTWLRTFRAHIESIPAVVGFYRVSGDYDYMLKIAAADIAGYDAVYQQIIAGQELSSVTSYFSMEAIVEDRPLPLRSS